LENSIFLLKLCKPDSSIPFGLNKIKSSALYKPPKKFLASQTFVSLYEALRWRINFLLVLGQALNSKFRTKQRNYLGRRKFFTC